MSYDVEVSTEDGRSTEIVQVQALSARSALERVLAQGRFPVSMPVHHMGRHSFVQRLRGATQPALSRAALAHWAEQLAELVRSRVALDAALSLLAGSSQGVGADPTRGGDAPRDRREVAVARLSARALDRIRQGASLSEALRAEPDVARLCVGLIQAAEHAGALADGLDSLAVAMRRQLELREHMVAALAYPIALVVMSALAALFVLTVVIPQFEPLFAGQEARLPVLTRAVLWCSAVVRAHGQWLLASGMGVVTAVALLWHTTPRLRQATTEFMARTPLLRHSRRFDAVQTAHMFALLLRGGCDVSQAMQWAGQAARFRVNRGAWQRAQLQVREGVALSAALSQLPDTSSAAATILAVGARSGDIAAAVQRAARTLERQTQREVERLLAWVNPLAVIGMGVLVALLVSAVMLGILSINGLVMG